MRRLVIEEVTFRSQINNYICCKTLCLPILLYLYMIGILIYCVVEVLRFCDQRITDTISAGSEGIILPPKNIRRNCSLSLYIPSSSRLDFAVNIPNGKMGLSLSCDGLAMEIGVHVQCTNGTVSGVCSCISEKILLRFSANDDQRLPRYTSMTYRGEC